MKNFTKYLASAAAVALLVAAFSAPQISRADFVSSLQAIANIIYGSEQPLYHDQSDSPLTSSYQQFIAEERIAVTVINDDVADTIGYSYDGVTLHGVIKPGESWQIDNINKKKLYLLGNAPDYRFVK